MTNTRETFVERVRVWIEKRDSNHGSIKLHKENICSARRAGKLVIFWSFISLCYALGDLNIVQDGVEVNNSSTIWGIQVSGITNDKILAVLLVINSYFLINLIFVAAKICLISKSHIAFLYMIFMEEKDRTWEDLGLSMTISKGELDFEKKSNIELKEEKELAIMMFRYRIMGFLEYFFTPIIFPILLSMLAILFLVKDIAS